MHSHRIDAQVRRLVVSARTEIEEVRMVPAGLNRPARALALVTNVIVNAYGHLELVPRMRFLSRYPVRSYIYDITPELSRGDRLSVVKLRALHAEGFGATVNLCAEMPDGDAPVIAAAGLDGHLQTYRHPIIDMNPPGTAEMVAILDTLVDLRDRKIRTHLNCEAGRARTGVVTACFRMAVMGWATADAAAEAKNFGDFVPMQLAFIEAFGAKLLERWAARQLGQSRHPDLGKYPLMAPGSVKATPVELAATVKQSAATSRHRLGAA